MYQPIPAYMRQLRLVHPPHTLAITRVSDPALGSAGDHHSLSGRGRYIAYEAVAGSVAQIVVHDRIKGASAMVSLDDRGNPGDDISAFPSISDDGNLTAFTSAATNLIPLGANDYLQVFVHDKRTGNTQLVSASPNETPGDGDSAFPVLCGSGRFLAFVSRARLSAAPANGCLQVYVRDLLSGETTLASAGPDGEPADGDSSLPSFSASGRHVAFSSRARNITRSSLLAEDNVFLRDLKTGKTSLAPVNDRGEPGDGASLAPALSGDGEHLAFMSKARNISGCSDSGVFQIVVWDIVESRVSLISVSNNGGPANDGSVFPCISGNGQVVAFASVATDLVRGRPPRHINVFAHNRTERATTLVSKTPSGFPANGDSGFPSITLDGHMVAFSSCAGNLAAGAESGSNAIYVAELG